MEKAAAAGISGGTEWTLNAFSARAARLKAPVHGAFALNPSEQQLRSKRASSRSRQQRRPSPQGAQEKDAARRHFPRDETSRSLRKTIGTKGAGKGGSDPSGPQARAQEDAARRPASGQATTDTRTGWSWRRSWRPRGPWRTPRASNGLIAGY